MAESGRYAAQTPEQEAGGPSPREPRSVSPAGGTKRHLPRGIVIQLTGTEGQWDSLDDSELIFSLDNDEDNPSIPLPEQRRLSEDEDGGPQSQSFHVPLSPSSPSSLGNCSAAGPSFLSPGPASPTHRPLASLVKSLSTELEPKEGSSLRPKPFLSLVKSISTELSRSEPEVSQSRSDSRLNLHLWKQLTQQKTRGNGDSRTAPPSPSSLSPSGDGPRGGFFKLELEDTRRKLSEAVHEPLSSMLSKILREEGGGSPKHHSRAPQGGSRAPGRDGSTDTATSDSPVRNARKPEVDALPVFDWPPVRPPGRGHCPVHRPHGKDEDLEVCTDGDVMKVLAAETRRRTRMSAGSRARPPPPPHPLPRTSLFCVAVLSYGYFTLPLGPYWSGLALGLALGFLLGLLLIRVGSSRSSCSGSARRPAPALPGGAAPTASSDNAQPEVLKGWMNEIPDYDPETCHPALTHSVFATLEGSSLRLDTPRSNISRRAAYDERVHEATFVTSRRFQLAGSQVYLLPPALARKRLWNPKYPICIRLAGPPEEGEGGEEGGGQDPGSPGQTEEPPYLLYLFGRTGREKEEWFRHLTSCATRRGAEPEPPGRCASRLGEPMQGALDPDPVPVPVQVPIPGSRGPSRVGSSDDDPPSPPGAPLGATKAPSVLDYHSYMAGLLAAEDPAPPLSPAASSTEPSPSPRGAGCTCDLDFAATSHTSWINALIGRIFWDALREKHWADAVSHKVQKKLSRIRLPHFMNDLTLTDLDLGSSMPHVTAASRPEVDHRGLWVELQLVYTGCLQMTLQTKFNLTRLGKEGGQCWTHSGSRPVLAVLADSDEESSSAGSSDEEEPLLAEPPGPAGEKGPAPAADGAGGAKTGRKILRLVDKIAKSRCFQKATENEFIRKKFQEMSNTPLLLAVELQELSGRLLVNVPPPPTDRIWYSFCEPPKLELQVRPQLGGREVTFCHVTEWIEKKLQEEFQKVFVLPNMDDLYVPLMRSAVDESIQRVPAERRGAEPL